MTLQEQILQLFNDDSEKSFNKVALNVFHYQAESNPVYKQYLNLINCDTNQISHYKDIPLLPISLFKRLEIKSGAWTEEKTFLSSGTMQDGSRSRHFVKSVDWYNQLSSLAFRDAHYDLNDIVVLGLLPSYIENGDSSLVHMVGHFQTLSNTAEPANYLYDFKALNKRIKTDSEESTKKIVLIGVTYALLDFAELFQIDSDRLDIIFTGGMKRRRQELDYSEVESLLRKGFPSSKVRAEYGMTEMLSQAYSSNGNVYTSSPTMRTPIKQFQDPFTNERIGKSGMLGIIDLGNIDSQSFILTEDIGLLESPKSFQVLGRQEVSDIRGCNLLYQDHF